MPKRPIQIKVKFETAKFNRMLMTKVIPSSRLAARDIIRMAALEVLSRTIKCWPVDTGRSRAAWLASFDAAQLKSGGGLLSFSSKGSSPAAIAEGRALGSYEETATLHGLSAKITNAVGYAPMLEAGWSKQAPSGCLRRAMSGMRREIGKSPMVRRFIKGLKGVRHTI